MRREAVPSRIRGKRQVLQSDIPLRVAIRLLFSDSPLATLDSALSPSHERRRLPFCHHHDRPCERALFSCPKKGKYT